MKRLLSLLTILAAWPLVAEPLMVETFDAVPDGELPAGWRAEAGQWSVQDGALRGVATAYISKLVLPLGELSEVAVEASVQFEAVKDETRWLSLMVRQPAGQAEPFLLFTHRFDRTRPNGTEIGLRTGGETPGWHIYRASSVKIPPQLGEAHLLRCEIRGRRMVGYIDGQQALAAYLPSQVPAAGEVGLVVSGVTAIFDDLRVEPLPPPEPGTELPTGRPRPLIIAHRGYSARAPENTLAAISEAFEAGADGVEIDVAKTADGHLVLLHDKTVDRTTNGQGPVAELTLEQVRALDAGSWKDPRYAGQRVPTFGEALEAAAGRGPLLLDLKAEGLLELIAEAVRAKGQTDQVILCCWSASQAADARQHLPEAPASHLGAAPAVVPPDWFGTVLAKGLRALSLNYQSLTPEIVRAARLRAMPVFAWTVNDPGGLELCCAMGADGILTDDPEMALATLEARRH